MSQPTCKKWLQKKLLQSLGTLSLLNLYSMYNNIANAAELPGQATPHQASAEEVPTTAAEPTSAAASKETKVVHPLPSGFVFLAEVDPTIIESPRYATAQNFLGRPVPGYVKPAIVSTRVAAEKLSLVNQEFQTLGYNLVVYDGYRPQCAIDAFRAWSSDAKDQVAKALYYPTLTKYDVITQGYLGTKKSSHGRGSTFDLTIIPKGVPLTPIQVTHRTLCSTGEQIPFLDDGTVDMGSSFDLFHTASHHDAPLVSAQALKMRNLFRGVMKKYNFREYQQEWWHYTLNGEPYPDTYFEFNIDW